jgi:pentatricopeptide repeat protein
MGAIAPKEGYGRAKQAVDTALGLDDTLAEAHNSLASFKEDQEWDWAGAEEEYKRAIELNPGYATAHQWYALLLSKLGRHEEAFAQISRAVELDPLSLVMNRNLGQHFRFSRRYDLAITQLKKTIDLDPNFASAYFELGSAYSETGRHEEALVAMQKGVALQSDKPLFKGLLICVYARAGRMGEARRVLQEVVEFSRQNFYPSDDMAANYACLNDRDQAFTWLERAFQERSGRVSYLKVDRYYDSIRDDPRFRDLLRRLNLPAD